MLDWEAVGVNPAANDLVYFLTVGLRAKDAAEWEDSLLAAYHEALTAARASARGGAKTGDGLESSLEDYTLSDLTADYHLMSCVLLVVQACFATADIFKGWGNNKGNLLPWMVRLCKLTTRLDASAICALLPKEACDEVTGILHSMKEKATAGLERLSGEHGVEVVAGL